MNKISEDAYFERMRALALKVSPINENKAMLNQTLVSSKKAADGFTYGIVKEGGKYFIKKANGKGILSEADFIYIGGLENKLQERHDTYQEAVKRLDSKVFAIGQLLGEGLEDLEDEEGTDDMPPAEDEVPAEDQAPAEDEMPAEDEAPATGELPAEDEVPAEDAAPVEDEMPVEDELEGGEDEAPVEDEVPAEDEFSDEEMADDEAIEGESDDESEIQSILGRLTQLMRTDDMNPALAKSILNSVISATDFSDMDKKSKRDLILRIKTGGKKIEEDEENEGPGLYELEDLSDEVPSPDDVPALGDQEDEEIFDDTMEEGDGDEVEDDLGDDETDVPGIEADGDDLPAADISPVAGAAISGSIGGGTKKISVNLKDQTIEMDLTELRREIRKQIRESKK